MDDFTFTATAVPADVTVMQALSNGRAYRLLSAPVTGVTVDALADVNLVQGIAGNAQGAPNEAQYPDASPNIYIGYKVPGAPASDVFGSYQRPVATSAVLTPGRGFFWQLYDQRITPNPSSFGGGTSESYLLANRPLTATGPALSANQTVTFASDGSNTFHMGGNPFATAMTADGITATAGTLNNFIQVYGPTMAGPFGYTTLPRDATTTVSTWQGFFLEQTAAEALTVAYDASKRVAGNGTVVGRPAAARSLALSLAGTTAEGVATGDEAAMVHVTDAATVGFDADDASKLTPPAGPYALIAPVGTRDGEAARQSVLSLPEATGDVTLAFTATHTGTYTLTAEATGLPTTATLRDLATGALSDLTAGYTFTSAATDWTERFVVSFGRATAGEETAAERTLTAPRPNPATARAALTLRLPASEHVRATVVDALGRSVATLYDAEAPAGADVALDVDTFRLSPGVYVVRVQGATFTETRRLTVVR